MEASWNYAANQYIPGHNLCNSKNDTSFRDIHGQPTGILTVRRILGRNIFSSHVASCDIRVESDE